MQKIDLFMWRRYIYVVRCKINSLLFYVNHTHKKLTTVNEFNMKIKCIKS